MSNDYCLLDNFKDFSADFKTNRTETTKKLKKLYPTPNSLTDVEKQFILMWGRDSFPLLSYLRAKLNNNEEDEYLEFFHENLNRAINKYNNIKINSILHRMVFNDFFIEDQNKVGVFNTPISTTFDSNSNLDFGNFHISILAPIGSNGAYIEEIMYGGNYSQHLNEWILPTGTVYKTLFKNYDLREAIIILGVG